MSLEFKPILKLTKILLLLICISSCAKNPNGTSQSIPVMVLPEIKYNYPCTGVSCKTVLSIGDSISIGSNILLAPKINSQFNLFHPSENCRNSWYTAQHIDQWLAERPNPDIIIWNNGIWNTVNATLANLPGNIPAQYGTTLDEYRAEITEIAKKLKMTNARVIFFTSTELDSKTGNYFDWWKIDQLNQVAMDTLPGLGIEVADLHAISLTLVNERTDGIHYTGKGYDTLANFIQKTILGQ